MSPIFGLVDVRYGNRRWSCEEDAAVETQGVMPVQISAQVPSPSFGSNSPMMCVDRPRKVCSLLGHS